MQKQNTTESMTKQKLRDQLRQFGFLDTDIQKALQFTSNKQIAAEIILKIMEQGPDTDLSIYKQADLRPKQPFEATQQVFKKQQSILSEKPIRPKMLFVVNGSLKMGKGKICAQVGHAVIGAYLQIEEEAKFDDRSLQRLQSWQSNGSPKIVVKAPTQEEMLGIRNKIEKLKIGINTYLVQDAGHTQIKAGSKTVLAIGPAFSNQIDPFTEHLKLA